MESCSFGSTSSRINQSTNQSIDRYLRVSCLLQLWKHSIALSQQQQQQQQQQPTKWRLYFSGNLNGAAEDVQDRHAMPSVCQKINMVLDNEDSDDDDCFHYLLSIIGRHSSDLAQITMLHCDWPVSANANTTVSKIITIRLTYRKAVWFQNCRDFYCFDCILTTARPVT
jgi:hypothetical protein